MLTICGCLLYSYSYGQQINTLTPNEKQNGWKLLFNGKNLNGWHAYNKTKSVKNWSVQNGIIEVNEEKGQGERSDLVTDGVYGSFDLKLEWKMITPCGNSGVMFHVKESPKYKKAWMTGPEMQIADLSCRKIAKNPNKRLDSSRRYLHRAGALYGLVPAKGEWVKPAGHWNKYEIIADNNHLQYFVNGHKVVDVIMWDKHWKQMVAHSKFKSMPNFGTFHKGHISLQGTERGKIHYRNIKIKELNQR